MDCRHRFDEFEMIYKGFFSGNFPQLNSSTSCSAQDTVDHTPAGTGNYFSHGSLSKIFFVEFKSESLKNKKVSKFQQL